MEPALVADIYADILGKEQVPELMGKIGATLSAQSSFMFSSHSETAPEAMLVPQNMCPAAVEGFSRYWHQEDVWAKAAARRGMMRRDVVVRGTDLMPQRDYESTRFYNEFARDGGMGHMLGSVLFDGSEGAGLPFVNLCWYRDVGEADFEVADREALRALLPHLQQAMVIRQRLLALRRQQDAAVHSHSQLKLASLLLDASGLILQTNVEADRLLIGGNEIVRSSGGRVRALGRRCFPLLSDALAVCRVERRSVPLLVQSSGAHPLIKGHLVYMPAAADTPIGAQSEPRYLLLLELPRDDAEEVAHLAARLFEYSPAEQVVAVQLIKGMSAEQIAQHRQLSLATVRTQVRAVLVKSGVTRQIDLVRMLMGL